VSTTPKAFGVLMLASIAFAAIVSGAPAAALTEAQAVAAVERFIAAWNTRDPVAFAATLNYPHLRPSPEGGGEVYTAAADYAASVDFASVERTGWHHTVLDSARVVHLGPSKAHVAGRYTRIRTDGSPILTTEVTYVVTERDDAIGIQARFAAGKPLESETERSAAAQGAIAVVKAYLEAFNARDEDAWAATLHFPHVRLAGDEVRTWATPEAYLADFDFAAFAARYGWQRSEWDSIDPVQVAADGVNVALRATRRDAAGKPLSSFDTLYLVTRENGRWGVRARSSFAE
jgi:hypothetical protein